MKNFSTPIRIILISSFFMSFGYFAVYAFLAIYLTNFLHFSALQVGTILTIIIITSRMIPFLSGIIADKFGYMIMMIAGLLLRGGWFYFPRNIFRVSYDCTFFFAYRVWNCSL